MVGKCEIVMTGVNGATFRRFRNADTNFASSCAITRFATIHHPSGFDCLNSGAAEVERRPAIAFLSLFLTREYDQS